LILPFFSDFTDSASVESGSVELEFVFVESAQQHGTEVDRAGAVGDLLESDVLLEQGVADIDPSGLPSDASVATDATDIEVAGVLRLGQAIGVGSG
jgi:hypothetical protein